MKVQVKPNETVNRLLFRVFGVDSDELEEAFYRLNPNQTTPFLEPGQVVELPTIEDKANEVATREIPVWT
ncbi:hypothetical protein JC606_17985 [Vibrio sp. IB15]|uniref:phage tail protein n=1 Tax=Vibrio TaxID=662 RepID=UPI000C8175AA|nr:MULTISPECIES: phage tail protein [Vibrio]MBJ2148251.1 hypothetical protein [Vibrio sp. IB15]PMG66750.1 hypothetical protein BCU86_12805 [Vibrio lentus]PMI81744.1 hypothetical protein BCU36_11885 [Vibrio lentus]PMJ00230.1 hypothetical protein BCU32_12040 [Vibrio lentus]